MIDTGILVTALIGLISTSASSILTWFLSKRKYNSEVTGNEIKNMKEALDFYKLNYEANKRILNDQENEILKLNERIDAQAKEIALMKNQMLSVYSQVCLNFSCAERTLPINDITKPKEIKK